MSALLSSCSTLQTTFTVLEQCSTMQLGTAQHGTARHGTARHGTAQHSTAQQQRQPGASQLCVCVFVCLCRILDIQCANLTQGYICRAYTKSIQGQDRTWLAQKLQAELDSTDRQSCNGAMQLPKAEDQTGTAGGSPDVKELLQLRLKISAYQVSKQGSNLNSAH